MMDIDLLYVQYRQQELWRQAAARALAAQVPPTRRTWRTWRQDALQMVRAALPWRRAVEPLPLGPAPVVSLLAPHGQSGTSRLEASVPRAVCPGAQDRVHAIDPVLVGVPGARECACGAPAAGVPTTVAW